MRMNIIFTMIVVFGFSYTSVMANDSGFTGVYSDMKSHVQSGDILGTEILLVMASDGPQTVPYVVLQISDGWPCQPEVVRPTIDSDKIEFDYKGCGGGHFSGKIYKSKIIGSFGGNKVTLKKGKSFWQK